MTQARRKFASINEQRSKAVDELKRLKQEHQALEAGHTKLVANYANLKQSAGKNIAGADGAKDVVTGDEEWFDGIDSSSPKDQLSDEKREALEELEAFENQLGAVSGQLARDSESAVLERHSPNNAQARQATEPVVDNALTDELKAKVAEQEAEIQRLREQMAPLLGLPLAVSTREAERDRLADVLKSKEQEIADKDQAVAGKDKALAEKDHEIVRKQRELASKQQEIAGKDQQIAGKEQTIVTKEQELAQKAKALELKDHKIAEQYQEVQNAQQAVQVKQNEVRSKDQTIDQKEKEIAELNAALRQRTEREATLNRELATAKRAEEEHREEIQRLAADKDRELKTVKEALEQARRAADQNKESGASASSANNELGNLGREVKDSSTVSSEASLSVSTKPDAGQTTAKPAASGKPASVQSAPLGSTIAVDKLRANTVGKPVVNGAANVAAVDRSVAGPAERQGAKPASSKSGKAAPRQFQRAPSRIDNLKEIKGIGPVLERMLNRLGVYQFSQIAQWSSEDIDYFDTQLADFRGRIRRDDWPAGARVAYSRKYG